MGQSPSQGYHQKQLEAKIPPLIPGELPCHTIGRLAYWEDSIDEAIPGTPAFVRRERRSGPVSSHITRPSSLNRCVPRFGCWLVADVYSYQSEDDED